MGKKNNNWIFIVVVAAVVAALTAVAVLILRARAKRKAWYDQEAIDCDMEDADCFEFTEEDSEPAETVEE